MAMRFALLFGMLLINSILLAQVSIIPIPQKISVGKGNYIISPHTAIDASSHVQALGAAKFLQSAIKEISGYNMPLKKAANGITLQITPLKNNNPEAYTLSVSNKGIVIKANTKAGLIYGIQTILQTLPAIRTNAILAVPYMEIEDAPSFAWRGMHLDESRHFFGPETVKAYIDLLARYKLNTFHWHLSDDQGWRIEIKKYPRLTSVGAWRVNQNHILWGARPQAKEGEVATYGGYYTQQQIKDIVAYAAQRNVTIVPELDVPGHSAAAIAAYPWLSCRQQPQLPMTGGNYKNMASNLCPGNDSVFTFLQDVYGELMALFPSTYIHLGGDEVDKTDWKKCARCQARIKNLGLKDEHELQSYFIGRLGKFIESKQRKFIGWDEILEGGLAPGAAVMSWRGEAGGIEAANMKHFVVMSPGNPLYFDHYQAGPEGEPPAFGGFNTLKMVYDYNPIPAAISPENARYILGAQANVWAEYIQSPQHVFYMALPRMLALSESLWSGKDKKDWNSFSGRLQNHFNYFDQKGIRYCSGNFAVKIDPVVEQGKVKLTMSTEMPGATIYYTTDGTYPSLKSNVYNQPIWLDQTARVQAVVEHNGIIKTPQPSLINIEYNKATGAVLSFITGPANAYKGNGTSTLTDGIRGNYNIHKHWLGYNYQAEWLLDLKQNITASSISLGCMQKFNDWILLPEWVEFSFSTDNINFSEPIRVVHTIDRSIQEAISDITAAIPATPFRYVRIEAKQAALPPGHNGAGRNAWIFADEIMIK